MKNRFKEGVAKVNTIDIKARYIIPASWEEQNTCIGRKAICTTFLVRVLTINTPALNLSNCNATVVMK